MPGCDRGKRIPEIGPGTGQAAEPLLQTGCDHAGIELGVHLCGFCRKAFAAYPNASFVNAACTMTHADPITLRQPKTGLADAVNRRGGGWRLRSRVNLLLDNAAPGVV